LRLVKIKRPSGRATPGCTITAVVSDILSSSSANNVFYFLTRVQPKILISRYSLPLYVFLHFGVSSTLPPCYLRIPLLFLGPSLGEDRDSPTRVTEQSKSLLSFFLAPRCLSPHARGDCPLDAVRVANLNDTIIPHIRILLILISSGVFSCLHENTCAFLNQSKGLLSVTKVNFRPYRWSKVFNAIYYC